MSGGKGRKRHGGRRANRGTPPGRDGTRRHYIDLWALAADVRASGLEEAETGVFSFAGHPIPYTRVEFAIINNVSAAADAIVAKIGALLCSFTPDAEHRIRCDMRYDEEIAAARARGWTETAVRIEAERAEWMADTGMEQAWSRHEHQP